jgi:uncharacterized protein (TIGR03067 family)
MKPLYLFTFALCVAMGSLLHAAPAPKEKEKGDLAKMQGAWTFSSWEHNGVALPEGSRDTTKWTVKDDKYTFEISGSLEEGTIKLDNGKKPAMIDLVISSGTDEGKTQVGIYKIDGETVTFCLARPGVKERPTEFKSTAENQQILVTIKKMKKDD